MNYVAKANLPINTKIVLIGSKYSKLLEKTLKNMGIYPIFVPDNPFVDKRLSGHTDLSLFHFGSNEIAASTYLKGSAFAKRLEEDYGFKLIFPCSEQREVYPFDAGFNLCFFGDNLIYNPKTANAGIAEYLTSSCELKTIKVKQGYSKCSVCVVNENAIISSDVGICSRAVEAGISVLKIRPGYIFLNGFDYGFIGGASFKMSENSIAFTGHLDNHPDKDSILNFLCLHNVKPVYITDLPAFDIGSAIQIVEK